MDIKPLTIYELINGYNNEIIKFKTSNDMKETIILQATKYKVGSIHTVGHWYWLSFKEVKSKINHLPEWL